MLSKLSKLFFPKIEENVQRSVDDKSLSNIWRTCIVIFIFEAIALLVFISTRTEFDHSAWISIESASFCLILCLVGALGAGKLRQLKERSHILVAMFNGGYYLLLSLWAVHVAYRNYCNNEQILTFFAVQLMMVCFVPLRPLSSIIFASITYISMYLSMCSVDGGMGLNIFNFVLLLLVTITGMIVRYHSEISASEKSVKLEQSYDDLFYANRHDGLTGLRNRKALEEDVPKIVGSQVTAYMIDVNYFKEINDNYGHSVGDRVLEKTAQWLKSTFSEDRCYRYGGDEFLILSSDDDFYKEDTFSVSVPEMHGEKVMLSIGHAIGEPSDHDELFKLISQADDMLYVIKERVHSPEFGGHGERKKSL